MTHSEFDRWWNDAQTRWPSLQVWLQKCFTEAARKVEFLRNWRAVLSDVPFTEALEVNRQMQAGDLPLVGEYDADKERLPQHVRRLARQLAYESRKAPGDEAMVKELKPTSFPAGKILRRILELTARGAPIAEARAIVLAELPVGKPAWEPRYHCLICLDVGMVTIASQTALDYLLADKFHECHHRESAIRCLCRPALPHDPKRKPVCVYDPEQDFKIIDFGWGEDEVARFSAWVEMKRHQYWESKRHPDFDTFNQRAFA